jgi:hypothetical protein
MGSSPVFDSYLDWGEQNDPVVADVMIRVGLSLGNELLLGGEVSSTQSRSLTLITSNRSATKRAETPQASSLG